MLLQQVIPGTVVVASQRFFIIILFFSYLYEKNLDINTFNVLLYA